MTSFLTNKGLANFVASLVGDNLLKWIGWGTGSGRTVTDNDLASPAPESRVNGVNTQQTKNTNGDTFRVVGTLTALAARAITEVGVFTQGGTGNPPSGGDMGIYADFAVLNLNQNDSITFTIDVTLDQA
jgi:hypothetical protein